MDDKELASLILAKLEEHTEKLDRLAGMGANQILLSRRSDTGNANSRLQMHASVNEIKADVAELRAALFKPEALAAVVSKSTIDQARQIKHRGALAVVDDGEQIEKPRRDDDITLVSVRVNGDPIKWRLTKRKALALVSLLSSTIGWLVRHGLHTWLHW